MTNVKDEMIRCHNWWIEECTEFTCQLIGECFIYIDPEDLEDFGFKTGDKNGKRDTGR